MTNFIA